MISHQSTTNDVARPDAKDVKTYMTNKSKILMVFHSNLIMEGVFFLGMKGVLF